MFAFQSRAGWRSTSDSKQVAQLVGPRLPCKSHRPRDHRFLHQGSRNLSAQSHYHTGRRSKMIKDVQQVGVKERMLSICSGYLRSTWPSPFLGTVQHGPAERILTCLDFKVGGAKALLDLSSVCKRAMCDVHKIEAERR